MTDAARLSGELENTPLPVTMIAIYRDNFSGLLEIIRRRQHPVDLFHQGATGRCQHA